MVLDFIKEHWLSIVYILVVLIITAIVLVVIFSRQITTYLDNNWREVRCYPHIIPIAGLSSRGEGNNFFSKTFNNFNGCTNSFLQKFLSVFTKPLMSVIHGLNSGTSQLYGVLNNFRNMAKVIRELYASLVENIFDKMSNSYSAVIYLQEKLKNIVRKQTAIFELVKQFGTSLPMLMYSFNNGPITRFGFWLKRYYEFMIAIIVSCFSCFTGFVFACPVCALCFAGDTLIEKDGLSIPIRQLNIGDNINGSKITGKIEVRKENYDMYMYRNICVSGSHLTYYNNKWIRVEDIEEAKKINMETDIICFMTDNHIIDINGIKFKDYRETDDINTNLEIHYIMTRYINGGILMREPSKDINHTYHWCFNEDTRVKINNTIYKISDIVNCKLYSGDIMGGVSMVNKDICWYNYRGIIVSGNTLVMEKKIWIRVHQSKLAEKLSHKYIGYNLITNNNIIEIVDSEEKEVKFRDMVESFDGDVNERIDNILATQVNKEI